MRHPWPAERPLALPHRDVPAGRHNISHRHEDTAVRAGAQGEVARAQAQPSSCQVSNPGTASYGDAMTSCSGLGAACPAAAAAAGGAQHSKMSGKRTTGSQDTYRRLSSDAALSCRRDDGACGGGGACPSPAPLPPALSAQSERGRLGVVAASGTAPQLLAAASVLQFPLPLPLPLLLSLPPLLLRSNCGTCSCGSTTAGFCHVMGFAGCRSACSASSPSPPTLGSRTALCSWLLPAESSLLALVVLRVLRQAVAGLLCSHYPGRAPCAVASRGPSVVGWCWLRGGASASPPSCVLLELIIVTAAVARGVKRLLPHIAPSVPLDFTRSPWPYGYAGGTAYTPSRA